MCDKPITTPQTLHHQAERAIRLARGILDKPAKAALLALAEELLQKAAQLEAATPTISPTEATGTAAAMQDTTDSTKPSGDEGSR